MQQILIQDVFVQKISNIYLMLFKNMSLASLRCWEDLPSDLMSEIVQYLSNDIRDIHRFNRVSSQWHITFKYTMNENEHLYHNGLLHPAILQMHIVWYQRTFNISIPMLTLNIHILVTLIMYRRAIPFVVGRITR